MKRPRTKVSRKTSSSAAAQIFASIDDLLIQVFLRLPRKQLYRFKLVSKHWNSIISDPKLPLFLRKPEPAVGLIFQYRNLVDHHGYLAPPFKSKTVFFNQPAIPKPLGERFGRGALVVLNSCNGLLLCSSKLQDRYIYNPLTKKSSTLYDPGTGEEDFSSSIRGMCLAFDPSESCHYKIVCVVRFFDRFKFEVYSSETGCWRRCGDPFSATTVDFRKGVYWKGAIHWLSSTKAGNSFYFNPCCGDENDRMLPTVMASPPTLEDLMGSRKYHFGESCGHLNFIDAYSSEVFEFNVYEMKTDYSEWFVKYRVDLSNVLVSDSFSVCNLVRGNKDDDDSFLVLRVGGKKFVRCNLVDNNTCETILEWDERKEEYGVFPRVWKRRWCLGHRN